MTRSIPRIAARARTDPYILSLLVSVAIAIVGLAGGVPQLVAAGAVGSGIVFAASTHRERVWRHVLSPLGAFNAMYVTLTLGGMAWLVAKGEGSLTALGVAWLTFACIQMGAYLARDRPPEVLVQRMTLASGYGPAYVVLTAGLLAITFIALVIRPDIPLLVLLTHPGDWALINQARFDYTTGQPGFGFLSQAFQNGLPYVATFAFLAARVTHRLSWRITVAALFTIDVLALILSTQRGLVLWFVLLFVVAADAKAPRVSVRRIGYFVAAVAVVLFGILAFRTLGPGSTPAAGIASTILGGIDRLFLEQNRVANFVVDLPRGYGHYFAVDLHPIYNRLILLNSTRDIGFSGMVYNLMFPNAAIQGTAPSLFTTQFYADFWWPGVAGAALVVGTILGRLEVWLSRATDVGEITLIVAMTLAIARMQQVDVTSAVLDFGVIGFGACYVWLRLGRSATIRWQMHRIGSAAGINAPSVKRP